MHAGIRSGIYNLTPTPLLHERELEDLRGDYVFQKKNTVCIIDEQMVSGDL